MGEPRVFRKRIRVRRPGLNVDADVNVTIATNVGGRGSVTRVSSRQRSTASTSSREGRRAHDPTDEDDGISND